VTSSPGAPVVGQAVSLVWALLSGGMDVGRKRLSPLSSALIKLPCVEHHHKPAAMVKTLIILSITLLPARLRITASMADSSERIGGGAINEKIRMFDPSKPSHPLKSTTLNSGGWDPEQNISHMLHAIVGLDRYPNYLSRFQNIEDVVALENALKQTLQKVEQQKKGMVERRNGIADLVNHYNKRKENQETIEDDTAPETTTGYMWGMDLSPPKTWSELKRRKVLHEDAFKVAHQSMKSNEVGDIINGNVILDLKPSLLEDLMEQEMFDVYSFPLFSVEVSLLLFTLHLEYLGQNFY
jgi:hypothetical protein